MTTTARAPRAARRKLRIAQIAPLYESVPPRLYGGTERVVASLCDALARRGHEVTLFASGDSTACGRLVAPTARPLERTAMTEERTAAHALELALVLERAHDFDVLHAHIEHLGFAALRASHPRALHTIHSRLDVPYVKPLYSHSRDLRLVSVSDAQREPLRELCLHWVRTVHHGLALGDYPMGTGRGGYLAFFGRLSPEKGPETAIEVARRTGLPIKLAAKINDDERGYVDRVIRPLLKGSSVEFIGEVGGAERVKFLGDATALLFPIKWPEPFGLAMIEALACGTPVVAFRRGSVPEIVSHARTGYVVDTFDEMVEAVRRLDRIDRAECRLDVERRFTDDCMAAAYEEAYERVLLDARAS